MNWSQNRPSQIPSTFPDLSISSTRTQQEELNARSNSFCCSNSSSCSSSPIQPHIHQKSFSPNKSELTNHSKTSFHHHPKKQHLSNYNNQITKAEPDSTTQRQKLQASPENRMSVSTFGSGAVEPSFYNMLGTVRQVAAPGQLVGSYYVGLEHYAANVDHSLDQSSYVAAVQQQLQNNPCSYPTQQMFMGNFSSLDQSVSQYGLHSTETNNGNPIHKVGSLPGPGLIQGEYGMSNNNNLPLHAHPGGYVAQSTDYSRYTNFYTNSNGRHPFINGNFDTESNYLKEEPTTNLFPIHAQMNETGRMLLPGGYQTTGLIQAKLSAAPSLPEQELTTYKETKEKRPCDVCSDVSAGFHCNAFVCEACKKFFIRSSKSNNFLKYSCSKNSNCDIVKDTRTHCQHCRYQKCLRLGMSLPGSNQPSGADISVIPCRVCGAQSSGFHFGAITCEGCKGFFRRTINERDNQKYTCSKGGNCVINTTTRNNCKSCRYDTCLRVGMSKGGSRIGRQPNAVKHMCAIEIEKIKTTTQHTNSFLHPSSHAAHQSHNNSAAHHASPNVLYQSNRIHASNYSLSTSNSSGVYQSSNHPSDLSPSNQLYVSPPFGGSSNGQGHHYLSPSYQSSASHHGRDSTLMCQLDKYNSDSNEHSGKVYTSLHRIRKYDYETSQTSNDLTPNNSRFSKDGVKTRMTFSGINTINESCSPTGLEESDLEKESVLPKTEMMSPDLNLMTPSKSPKMLLHSAEPNHHHQKRRCLSELSSEEQQHRQEVDVTSIYSSNIRTRHTSQSSTSSNTNWPVRATSQTNGEICITNQSTEMLKQNLVSVTIEFQPDMPEFSFLYHINQAAKQLCQCRRRETSPLSLEGNDIDESLLWKYMMRHFQAHAYQVINFARSLPGFYSICNNDRMTLVQEAMYPIILFQFARDFNPVTKEFNYFNFSKEEREIILSKFSNFKTIADHLILSGELIKPFALDDTETALICCIELLKGATFGGSLDSDSLEDPHTIREIHSFAVKAFLSHTCKQSENRGHNILNLLPTISQMNKEHQSIIMNLKKTRPHLQFPELYIQMFQLEPGESN